MGETREAKRNRLDREAARMRGVVAPVYDDVKEAYRIGYNFGCLLNDDQARLDARSRPPFVSVEMRAAWRQGFDDSKKGLAVKIPPGAMLRP